VLWRTECRQFGPDRVKAAPIPDLREVELPAFVSSVVTVGT